MIHFRAWQTWHGSAIKKVLNTRKSEGRKHSKSYTMDYVSMSRLLVHSDGFLAYSSTVGPRVAEGLLYRALAYAAGNGGGFHGTISVDRKNFAMVLSTPSDMVSRSLGIKVYDALVKSGIAIEGPPNCDGACCTPWHTTSDTECSLARASSQSHSQSSPPNPPERGGRDLLLAWAEIRKTDDTIHAVLAKDIIRWQREGMNEKFIARKLAQVLEDDPEGAAKAKKRLNRRPKRKAGKS